MFHMCTDDAAWNNHDQSYKVLIEQKILNNEKYKLNNVQSTEMYSH